MRRRARWLIAISAACLLLLGAGLALALPEATRRLTERRIATWVTGPVTIARVRLNPFTGRARVEDVVVAGQSGQPPIVQIARVDLDVSYRALLRGRLALEYLTLHAPRLLIERTGVARFNIVDVLRARERAGGGWPVTVDYLAIRDGVVRFIDHTERPAADHTFERLELTAGRVSTLPGYVGPTGFEGGLEVGKSVVTVRGDARPFGDARAVQLTARLHRLDPALLAPYLPVPPRLDLAGSWLDAELTYVLEPGASSGHAHRLTASAALGPARLLGTDRAPVLSVAGMEARGFQMDLSTRRGRLAELTLRDPRLRLERDPAGRFALGAAFDAPGRTTGASPESVPARRPRVVLEALRAEGGVVELIDRTTAPPVTARLHDLRVSVADLVFPAEGPTPFSVDGRFESAPVRARGRLARGPLGARFSLEATGIPLTPFDPYTHALLGVPTTRQGAVDLRLDVTWSAPREGAPAIFALDGDLVGRALRLWIRGVPEPLFTASRLTARVDRLTLLPQLSADVRSIQLADSHLRLVRDAKGRLDLARFWATVARDGPDATAPRHEEPAAPPPLAIRQIEVTRGRLTFLDQSVTPAFSASVADLRLAVRDLDPAVRRTPVELTATLEEGAPLRLSGWAAPFARPWALHLEGGVEGYEMSNLHPYPERFLGYRVRRGRASLALDVTAEGGQLSGTGELTVRRLDLGAETRDRFRERVGISLPLALSLLERRGQEIQLRLPLSGDLGHPRVGIGGVVWDALRNTMVKTLAAPFRALGTLVTEAGRIVSLQVDPIPFSPGSLQPREGALDRLNALTEFLRAHPAVDLELRGQTSPAEVEAIKRRRLREAVGEPTDGAYEARLEQAYVAAGGTPGPGSGRPREARESYLLERLVVTEADLRTLARDRARVIEAVLLEGGVRRARIFLAEPAPGAVPGAGQVHVRLLS